MKKEGIREIVRKRYAEIAKDKSSCCDSSSSCCQSTCDTSADYSTSVGYNEEELKAVPEDANLGLGCGNPIALSSLKGGETVLDLGSGPGLDCFLAANKVGQRGKVIGVDMTPEMIDRARRNAVKGNYKNVEFRLGEIENLPVADCTADIVISNCVINLSPDKERVFQEAFRALKPCGRLLVSDIVLLRELPKSVKNDAQAYVACVAGAEKKDKYLEIIKNAGFQDVKVIKETQFPIGDVCGDIDSQGAQRTSKKGVQKEKNYVASIIVSAVKPKNL
ncbi:arsenite methyltransferase [Candidatus Bathyarchaeota archaeon]|nr:arsenite methyltransferase [Candidatus Bathyarchaeota archaeon]